MQGLRAKRAGKAIPPYKSWHTRSAKGGLLLRAENRADLLKLPTGQVCLIWGRRRRRASIFDLCPQAIQQGLPQSKNMQEHLRFWLQVADRPMCINIPSKKPHLEKEHAGCPDSSRTSKPGEDHFCDHRLYLK